MATDNSLGNWFRNNVPEPARDVAFGFHPQKIVGDFAAVPSLPAAIATLLNKPNAAAFLSPNWVQSSAEWGDRQRASAVNQLGITEAIQPSADGVDIDYVKLLLQEGPLALTPVGAFKAPATASKAVKVGTEVLNQVINVAIPGAQGTYKIAAPISAAMTIGGPAVLDKLLEAHTASANMAPTDPLDGLLMNVDKLPAPPEPDMMDIIDTIAPNEDAFFKEQDSLSSRDLLTGVVAGLATVAAASGARALRAGSKAKAVNEAGELIGAVQATPGMQKTTGEKAAEFVMGTPQDKPTHSSLTGPVTKPQDALATQVLNRNHPIENALKQAVKGDALLAKDAEDLTNRLRTTANSAAMSSKQTFAMATGQLPDSKIRTVALSNFLNDAGTLNPADKAILADGLLARTRLDDMRAGKRAVWEAEPGRYFSAGDLSIIENKMYANPRIANLAGEYKRMMNDLVKYTTEAGITSRDEMIRLLKENPNYATLRTNYMDDNPSLLRKFMDTDPGLKNEVEMMRKRAHDMGKGVQAGEAANPVDLLPEYWSKVIKHTQINSLRRDIIDILDEGLGPDVVSRYKGDPSKSNDIIAFYRDGKLERWQVKDPGVRSALMFSPQNTNNIINKIRKTQQYFTTGTPNLLFSLVKSPVYEAWMSHLTIPKGAGGGAIDEILGLAGLPQLGKFDPSTHAALATMGPRIVAARSGLMLSQAFDLSIRRDGALAQLLGPQRTAAFRDSLARAYENSIYGEMQRLGGISNKWIEQYDADKVAGNLADVAAMYTRNTSKDVFAQARADRINRAINLMTDAAHLSVRLQSAAATKAKRGVADTALARQTRELTGDPTIKGGDPNTAVGRTGLVYGPSAAEPYFNLWKQTMARLYDAAKDDPAGMAGSATLMATGLMGYLAALSDEELSSYYNDTTPAQRIQGLPIFENGRVVGFTEAFPPEYKMFVPVLIEGVGGLYGLKDRATYGEGAKLFREMASLDANWDSDKQGDFYDGLKAGAKAFFPDVNPLTGGAYEVLFDAAIATSDPFTPGSADVPASMGIGGYGTGLSSPIGSYDSQSGQMEDTQKQALRAGYEDLFGFFGSMVSDAARAAKVSVDGGLPPEDVIENAADTFLYPQRRQAGASAQGRMLFGSFADTDLRASVGTHKYDAVREKKEIVDGLLQDFQKTVVHPDNRTATGQARTWMRNDLSDTELAVIGGELAMLNKQIASIYERPDGMNVLRERKAEFERSSLSGDPETRIQGINQIDRQRKELIEETYRLIEEYEDIITKKIGREFQFTRDAAEEIKSTPNVSGL